MRTGILVILLIATLVPPASAQSRSAWQVWSQQCATRYWPHGLPDYCIAAYCAVTRC